MKRTNILKMTDTDRFDYCVDAQSQSRGLRESNKIHVVNVWINVTKYPEYTQPIFPFKTMENKS